MKLYVLFAFVFFWFNGYSQLNHIEGKIQYSSTEIALGQAIIYKSSDSTLVKGTYVDSNYFAIDFKGEIGKEFYLKIDIGGYNDTLISFILEKDTMNFGTILINENTLETVSVVYKKPEFQRSISGIKINVSGTTLQTLNTLFDVLVASPKLNSPDGESIEIIGKGTPLILIDKQPIISVDELRAVPASMVESIEIITNPSAKYKAQGSGNGVIEVITKNFALEGYNMNLSLNGGLNTQLMPTTGGNIGLNVKRKKFTMSAYAGGNYNTQNSFGNSLGYTTDSSGLSSTSSDESYNWNSWMYYNLKSAYQINKNQKLSAGFRGHGSFGGGESISNMSYFNSNELITSNYSSSAPKYTWQNNSGFVNYLIITDTNRSSLEINLNVVRKASNSFAENYNAYRNNIFNDSTSFDIKTESYDKPLVGELRLNYEHIFDTTGWIINTGFSLTELRNNKIYNFSNYIDEEWIANSLYSNSYDYKEHLGTIYFEISKSWKKVSFRTGVTVEYTGLDGYSNSLQKQFIDSLYLLPFPSASIMYQPNDNVGLTWSYSSGINRPQFTNYDPFIKFEDSLNVSFGNPYLRPELSHTFEFQLDLFYAYNLAIYYTDVQDPIASYSFVNDSTFQVSTTPWNALRDKSIGADLSLPLQTKWLQGWNSFWVSYNYYSFTPEFGREPYSNLSFGIYSYLTFMLPKNFSIMNQLHVMKWAGADFSGNTRANWGVRLTKKYKNNDLQFYLDVQNIFPPKNKVTSYYGNYIYESSGQYSFTSFKLGMYYKFGRLKQASQIKESNDGQSGRI